MSELLRAQIDEKLERKFRELAMRRFGYGKGALSRAVEEAVIRWVSSVEGEEQVFEGARASGGRLSGRFRHWTRLT